MISLEVEGWSGATFYVETFDASDTWSYDDEIGRSSCSAVEVAQSIATWIPTWSESFTSPFALRCTGIDGAMAIGVDTRVDESLIKWTCSAELTALLGWASYGGGGGNVSAIPVTPAAAVGTAFMPHVALTNWSRWAGEAGPRGAGGAWMLGAASSHLRRPALDGTTDVRAAIALQDALDVATAPRRALVYQWDEDLWREVAVGAVTTERGDGIRYRIGLEVLG